MKITRPSPRDEDVISLALDKLTPRVISWLNEPNPDIPGIRADLAANINARNGYEFARDLERRHWSGIDCRLVEILDGADWDVSDAVNQLTEKWIEGYRVFPANSIGANVKWREHSGEITAIDLKRGKYTMFCPGSAHVREGMGTHGFIVPWEEIDGRIYCHGLTVTGPLFGAA